ncbi:MAG: TIGR04282 family arsenosugar biosynthesis glycosyltransferase [Sumerlaeia bacterium]
MNAHSRPLPLIVVFTRWPEPGAAKTRLAEGSSPEFAAGLYRCMVEMIVQELRPGAGRDFRLCVYASPPERVEETGLWLFGGQLPRGVEIAAQPAGTLAERLDHISRQAHAQGTPSVIFVGTDTIDLLRWDIMQALQALKRSPAVLGPAEDGGFWLLGMAFPDGTYPEGLFHEVTYSVAETTGQMEAALKRHGFSPIAPMPTRRDIDFVADIVAQPPWAKAELARRARAAGLSLPQLAET